MVTISFQLPINIVSSMAHVEPHFKDSPNILHLALCRNSNPGPFDIEFSALDTDSKMFKWGIHLVSFAML